MATRIFDNKLILNDHLFLSDSLVSPLLTGTPSNAEILTASGDICNTIVYYTGTDDFLDDVILAYNIDNSRSVLKIFEKDLGLGLICESLIGERQTVDRTNKTYDNGTTSVMSNDQGQPIIFSDAREGDFRWENGSTLRFVFDTPVNMFITPIDGSDDFVLNPTIWSHHNSNPPPSLVGGVFTQVTSNGTEITYEAGVIDAQIEVVNESLAWAGLPNSSAPSASADWGVVTILGATEVSVRGRDAEAMHFEIQEILTQSVCEGVAENRNRIQEIEDNRNLDNQYGWTVEGGTFDLRGSDLANTYGLYTIQADFPTTILYGSNLSPLSITIPDGETETFVYSNIIGWQIQNEAVPVDTFGTVVVASSDITTTNGVDILTGQLYIAFPGGTTFAHDEDTKGWAVSDQAVCSNDVGNGTTSLAKSWDSISTFTPDADGIYLVTFGALSTTQDALIYIGTSPLGNDILNTASDRINPSDLEKTYTVELDAGVTYHASYIAGGGATVTNAYFEVRSISANSCLSQPVVVDQHGTVLAAEGPLTTTNGVDINTGDQHIEFPDGTTFSSVNSDPNYCELSAAIHNSHRKYTLSLALEGTQTHNSVVRVNGVGATFDSLVSATADNSGNGIVRLVTNVAGNSNYNHRASTIEEIVDYGEYIEVSAANVGQFNTLALQITEDKAYFANAAGGLRILLSGAANSWTLFNGNTQIGTGQSEQATFRFTKTIYGIVVTRNGISIYAPPQECEDFTHTETITNTTTIGLDPSLVPLADGVEVDAFPEWTTPIVLTNAAVPYDFSVDLNEVHYLNFGFTRGNIQHATGRIKLSDFIYDNDTGGLVNWWSTTGFRIRINTADKAAGIIYLHYLTTGIEITSVEFTKKIIAVDDIFLPFADDTAAGNGGIVTGKRYQTDGTGAAPLNIAGIVMVKQ